MYLLELDLLEPICHDKTLNLKLNLAAYFKPTNRTDVCHESQQNENQNKITEMGPAFCYTLTRNTASNMKIWL